MESIAVYFERYLNYAIIISLFIFISFVNIRIRSVYKNHVLHNTENGITGRQAAELILSKNNLPGIYIIPTKGTLTDRYSLAKKQIYLSEKNYNKSSISSVAVAGHKAACAVLANQNNKFISFMLMLKPVVNILSTLLLPLLIIGMAKNIATIGELLLYLLLSFIALQVITLPAEFNVNRRALKELDEASILNEEELYCAKKVLNATALFNILFSLTTPISNYLRAKRGKKFSLFVKEKH